MDRSNFLEEKANGLGGRNRL